MDSGVGRDFRVPRVVAPVLASDAAGTIIGVLL